jgi:hypothetical protein
MLRSAEMAEKRIAEEKQNDRSHAKGTSERH